MCYPPFLQDESAKDTAKVSFWKSLFPSFSQPKQTNETDKLEQLQDWYNPKPVWQYDYRPYVTYELILPSFLQSKPEHAAHFAQIIGQSDVPVICEFVATATRIHIYITTSFIQADILLQQLQTIYPSIIARKAKMSLKDFHPEIDNYYDGVLEFGLENESALPLQMPLKGRLNSLNGLIPLMETIRENECIVYQVICQKALNPWINHLCNASLINGNSIFKGSPEFAKGLEEKVQFPFCFATVKALVYAPTLKRKQYLEKTLSHAVISYTGNQYNNLIVAPNSGYIHWEHIEEVEERKTRRNGMLLNIAELAGLFHIPPEHLRNGKLQVKEKSSTGVVKELQGHQTIIGTNIHHNISTPVTLSIPQRLRHTHIIGATGAGKSTLILHMMKQDVDNGHGFCLLDPHGDLVDDILSHIPEKRKKDVILLDPSDMDFPLGINVLRADTDAQRIVLSSDLTGLFRRFATSWGDQMEAILGNAINVFLERKTGGTMLELRRFLTDKGFRKQILDEINVPYLSNFWEVEFRQLRSGAVSSITTRLDTFLRPKVIRGMMNQKDSINFRKILNKKKILLVKLSQGLIGESNAFLLGSLITAKLYQYAQERQRMDKSKRKPFFFYMDEFQNFITPSMEALLSGARKFGLGLILAHQDLQQLQRNDAKIANSLLANAGVQVVFRVGVSDGKKLEQGFADFTNDDFQALSIGEAIVRVQRSDWNCNIKTTLLPKIENNEIYEYVLKRSRKLYSRPQVKVFTTNKSDKKTQSKQAKPKETVTNEKKETLVTQTKDKSPKEEIIKEELPKVEPIQTVKDNKRDINKEIEDYRKQAQEKSDKRIHRKMQDSIKSIGERYNWGAYIEHKVSNPKGFIDVALHINKVKIAVEISVTNSIDYEIRNIQKCLSNEYTMVFMCCDKETHLKNIEQRAKEKLTETSLKLVRFGNMDALDTFLHTIHLEQQSKVMSIRGWNVRVKTSDKTGLNSKDELIDTILKSMRK